MYWIFTFYAKLCHLIALLVFFKRKTLFYTFLAAFLPAIICTYFKPLPPLWSSSQVLAPESDHQLIDMEEEKKRIYKCLEKYIILCLAETGRSPAFCYCASTYESRLNLVAYSQFFLLPFPITHQLCETAHFLLGRTAESMFIAHCSNVVNILFISIWKTGRVR